MGMIGEVVRIHEIPIPDRTPDVPLPEVGPPDAPVAAPVAAIAATEDAP